MESYLKKDRLLLLSTLYAHIAVRRMVEGLAILFRALGVSIITASLLSIAPSLQIVRLQV